MHTLKIIGQENKGTHYTDRPTVKIIIQKGNKILLLNEGLLPGGGIEEGESETDAIHREIKEEIGAGVGDIKEVGSVTQFRNFLNKKYVIHGYSATLKSEGNATNPQDQGEASFRQKWLTVDNAKSMVRDSIRLYEQKENTDDSVQGKLYNLMATLEFIEALDAR